MAQVGLPIKRDWDKIYEKWASPWTPREEPRPEENPPLRAGTKDLRGKVVTETIGRSYAKRSYAFCE